MKVRYKNKKKQKGLKNQKKKCLRWTSLKLNQRWKKKKRSPYLFLIDT